MSKEKFLQENQRPGEMYAGLLLGQNGAPDQHIFLLPGEAVDVSWEKAKAWACNLDGELPTRREQSLLFANLKGEFKPQWYWSGEQHAADEACAWYQDFTDGYQVYGHKTYSGRARAIRRLIIDSFGNFAHP